MSLEIGHYGCDRRDGATYSSLNEGTAHPVGRIASQVRAPVAAHQPASSPVSLASLGRRGFPTPQKSWQRQYTPPSAACCEVGVEFFARLARALVFTKSSIDWAKEMLQSFHPTIPLSCLNLSAIAKPMTTISIHKDLELYFLGRNGYGHMCGATIFPFRGALQIEPITSRGVTGRCSIQIPIHQVAEFVEALQAAARELQPSQSESSSPSVDELIAQFGAWGEHPSYDRAGWQYEVANGDTQSGYWDYVVAKLGEEQTDSERSPDLNPSN